MSLIDRAKNILITPRTEWDAIAADTRPTSALITGYVLPLAAVAALASFIGQVFVGMSVPFMGTVKIGLLAGLVGLVFAIVMAAVMVFVVGFIADALAPTFGGQKDMNQAVKAAAYAYTPVWIVGVLAIIPALGILSILAALYAIYLMYLGLPKLMKAPQEKAAGYTAVVVVVAIVIGFVLAMVGGLLTTPAMMASGALGGTRTPSITYDKDSPLGKLEDFGKKMEAAGKKMEAAQQSGDKGRQVEAALGALGTALSGGKPVEPVQVDALKPFVPERFAGLARIDLRTERSGVAGLMVAKAEAAYGDGGDTRVELTVTDTGGAAGLLGLAAWLGVQGEKEDANRRESTRREGDRMIHEEIDKRRGRNEYTVVLGNRFIVSAEGRADIATLESAVNGLDLQKLATLK